MLIGEAAAADNAAQPTPNPETLDTTTGEPIPPSGEPAAPLMTPEEEAGKLIDLIAWGLEKFYPVLQYQSETKLEAAKKLAPVLAKYNVTNTILAKWGVEIEAGFFFGGLAYGSYLAVKASRQPPEEQPKKSWWQKLFRKHE